MESAVKQPLGLKLDTGKSRDNQYSFAKNAVLVEDSDRLLQNEPGNELVITLPKGRIPVGKINISRTEVVIFSLSSFGSYIGLQTGDSYTDIVEGIALNFNVNNPVKGFFVLVKGCERTIYFNDDLNPDRYFNLDDVDLFKTNNDWDVNKFKQKPEVKRPLINTVEVNNTGGSLKSGQYSFAVEILDIDQNTLHLSQSTRSVNVFFDSTANAYQNIGGSFNIDNTAETDGGKENTSKSITLNISNLDTSFYYYRIWILRQVSSDNVTLEVVKKGTLQRIINSSASITVRSITSEDIVSTYSDFLITSSNYITCRDSVLVTGRQVKTNLKSSFRDYSGFQQATNNILVNWVKKQITPLVPSLNGNPKNTHTPNDHMTMAGDEVYSLAIEYIFKDGTVSPAFPLIGRESNAFDLEVINYDDKNPDFKHLEVKETYYRYEVYNTAQADGTLGYYEAEAQYPDTVDCNGERLYPTGNIRYFKMPDRRLVPIYTTEGVTFVALQFIGLNFTNIVYPSTDIVSHRFLMAKRTEENKTVIDTGIIWGKVDAELEFSKYPEELENFNDIYPDDQVVNSDICAFHSPKQLVDGTINQADYFKINKLLSRSLTVTGSEIYRVDGENVNIRIRQFIDEYIDLTDSDLTNINITDKIDVGINNTVSSVLSSKPIRNYSFSNPITVLKCSDIYPRETKLSLVTIKKSLRPYENFESLQYIPLSDQEYVSSASTDSFEIYGGDLYISELEISNLWGTEYQYSLIPQLDRNEIEFFAEYANKIWVESEVNYGLLAKGTDCNTRYVQGNNFFDYMITKIANINEDTGNWILKAVCPEYYGYNRDFTFAFLGKINAVLPSSFKYCSSCNNNNPNLAIWSEQYFSEQITDSLRVFKSNNYKIIGENAGQITGSYFDLNRLIIRTEQSRYYLTPNPQELNTDAETVSIGTGDFLSIPSRELVSTNYGFAGGSGYQDELSTEFGLFSVDIQANRIFLINSGSAPEDLTDIKYGCSQWLRNNLSSTSPKTAIQLTYDPYFKRMILVHKENNWTMSFDLRSRQWVSFHSYVPSFSYNNGTHFYSFDSQGIYKHLHDGNYQTFYNNKFDWIVGFQFFKPTTRYLYSIAYYMNTINGNHDLVYPTFDKMWVHTTRQSTGYIKLIEQSNQFGKRPEWINTEATVIHADRNYRISKIRDLSQGIEIIDKNSFEPIPVNVDAQKPQHEQVYLNDKEFNVYLYSQQFEDYKMVFDFIQTLEVNTQL